MKKYNEFDFDYSITCKSRQHFVKLGNYVMTLTSVVLRENNWICVKAILSFVKSLLFTGKKREDEARSILRSQYFGDLLSNQFAEECPTEFNVQALKTSPFSKSKESQHFFIWREAVSVIFFVLPCGVGFEKFYCVQSTDEW